ncbi:MAG: hypothetical protein QXT68_00760 [Halobacteria archaeon]
MDLAAAGLGARADHPLLRRFREACAVYRLDPGNRDAIARRLLDKVISGVGGA